MKFKTLIIIVILIFVAQILFAEQPVKELTIKQKDANNREYLKQLNNNLVNTIDMLSAFKDKIIAMPESTKGADYFNTFLYEMTTENSKIIQVIRESDELDALSREEQIKIFIVAIKSDTPFEERVISDKENEKNKALLGQLEAILRDRVRALRKEILRKEELIKKKAELDRVFVDLHSRNYLYSLLLDFMEPSDKLSPENRDVLRQIVVAVQISMQPKK